MSLYKWFDNISRYISEAVVRIFAPSDDAYPVIGVQPFNGDPFQDKSNW